jgi:general secretion pathway protein K
MKRIRYLLRNHSSGSALLVVLVMLGMIAVLLGVVSKSVSGAAREMAAARANALSQADLRAGIELGVAAILKLGETMRSADTSTELLNRRISVRITNERARLDLNAAPKSMLAALFAATALDEYDAASLAQAVDDWRGGSASQRLVASAPANTMSHRLPGLDTFDTPFEGLKDLPKQTVGRRYFVHPVQLASVPGFSKTLLKSVLPFVTVANGSGQIDPYIAPEPVLEALPGTTSSQVQGFLAARDGNVSRDTALLMLGADKAFVTDTAAKGWRLEIVSAPLNARPHRREAVVALSKGDEEPFRILYTGDDERL